MADVPRLARGAEDPLVSRAGFAAGDFVTRFAPDEIKFTQGIVKHLIFYENLPEEPYAWIPEISTNSPACRQSDRNRI